MDTLVPLIKAVFIFAIFPGGQSTVWITDDYLLRQEVLISAENNIKVRDTTYVVYDLRTNYVYKVDPGFQVRDSSHLDTISKYEINIRGTRKAPLITSKIKKCKEYKACKLLTEEYGSLTNGLQKQTFLSYYVKAPWLDEILDNELKRHIAGFNEELDQKYRFLMHKYQLVENSNMTKMESSKIIDQGNFDPVLIRKIFSLPPGKDFTKQ